MVVAHHADVKSAWGSTLTWLNATLHLSSIIIGNAAPDKLFGASGDEGGARDSDQVSAGFRSSLTRAGRGDKPKSNMDLLPRKELRGFFMAGPPEGGNVLTAGAPRKTGRLID